MESFITELLASIPVPAALLALTFSAYKMWRWIHNRDKLFPATSTKKLVKDVEDHFEAEHKQERRLAALVRDVEMLGQSVARIGDTVRQHNDRLIRDEEAVKYLKEQLPRLIEKLDQVAEDTAFLRKNGSGS